jgi:SAM-dependent methyltransferase
MHENIHPLYSSLRNVSWNLKLRLGLKTPIYTEDRIIFEDEIQPYFIKEDQYQNILFVGCEYYTKHYNRWYKGKNYYTYDYNPRKRRFGCRKHIIDCIENVETHFEKESLDLILCNGVYGWGLNERDHANQAFNGCYQSLRPGGVLMVGWNGIDDERYVIPCPPNELESLQLFDPFQFPTRKQSRIASEGSFHHVFEFYQRPKEL